MHVAKLLNKTSVSELAELSNLSKPYISQVKHGKRPPSQKLLDALVEHSKPQIDYLNLFILSRKAMGVSPRTVEFYIDRLYKYAANVDYLAATPQKIQRYLNSIPANNNGFATRHASFRAIKTFHRWLKAEYGLNNPMLNILAPILGRPVLPSLTAEQVLIIVEKAHCSRDKAILSLFAESGLRLAELANIKPQEISWDNKNSRSFRKGQEGRICPLWRAI
ncbi:MAG TPA: helix-turn-helix domain-containing protein [Dehalococcoidia bacterium]|nr:helix-turn-helix domain-containing protein [Dehalococcoidia bacterium]